MPPIAHCTTGMAVCTSVLRHLVVLQPPLEDNLPATERHGVETRRGLGDEGGVVGAHGGTC